MKKITLFSILAAFVAVLSFSSCNTGSSDSYTPLTAQEKSNCYKTLDMLNMTSPTGDFTYYCQKGDKKYVTDSTTTANWSLDRIGTDSVLTIRISNPENGIAKALADYLPEYTNGNSNSGLKAALKNYKGEAKFVCPITVWYKANPIISFLKVQNLTYNLEYDGATHKVDFVFYYTDGYNYTNSLVYQGSNSSSNKNSYQMSMQFVLYGFKVDKSDKEDAAKVEVPGQNGTVNYAPFYFNVK